MRLKSAGWSVRLRLSANYLPLKRNFQRLFSRADFKCHTAGTRTRHTNIMPSPLEPNCRKCGTIKERLSSGILRYATCRRKRGREYYHRSQRYRKKMREQYYQRTYGVSFKELDVILAEQEGRCVICRTYRKDCPAPKASRYETVYVQHLYVDHDHVTGNVRGLLCNTCNAAIAFLKNSLAFIDAARVYLQKSKS